METSSALPGYIHMTEKTHEHEYMPDTTRLVPGANPDPASPNHAPVKSTVQARGGVTLGRMRWVLGISLTVVVIAFIVVWFIAKSGR